MGTALTSDSPMELKMKSHTFLGKTLKVTEAKEIFGVCDDFEITVICGNNIKALDSAIHEGLHAMGVPDEYVHDKQGFSKTADLARFLWRLGWRRK